MQVLYGEGVAIHTGPEPCAVSREGLGWRRQGHVQAGHRAAKASYPGCRQCYQTGRQHGPPRQREWRYDPAWSETPACTDTPCAGTGRSRRWPAVERTGGPCGEGHKAEARDER